MGVTSRTQVSTSLLCSFSRSWIGSSKIGLSQQAVGADQFWSTRRGLVVVAFRVVCAPFCLSLGRVDHCCERAIVAIGGSRDGGG